MFLVIDNSFRNGCIILTNDAAGARNYIPYEIRNGDIKLDVTTGFDVKENRSL